MLIGPVEMEDLDQLLELANAAGIGFTSLPSDRPRLLERIATSVDSFAESPESSPPHAAAKAIISTSARDAARREKRLERFTAGTVTPSSKESEMLRGIAIMGE